MAVSARMLEEVKRLLSALVLLGHYDTAQRVQSSLGNFQATQKAARKSIEEEAKLDDEQEKSLPASSRAVHCDRPSSSWMLTVLETP